MAPNKVVGLVRVRRCKKEIEPILTDKKKYEVKKSKIDAS